MNGYEKIAYYLFRKTDRAVKLGAGYGTRGHKSFGKGKHSYYWEFYDLYFDERDPIGTK